MRSPLESRDEAAVRLWAESRGWLAIKVGQRGWPDRVFVRQGLHVWIELKRRVGGKLTPLQQRRLTQLRGQGAVAHVCEGRDAAIGALETEWRAHVARKTEGL